MPGINDLNLNNWREYQDIVALMMKKKRDNKTAYRTIYIFGDKYKIRRTFDILDYVGDVVGYEACDGDGNFLLQYDCEKLSDLIKYLKWRIYKMHEIYIS